jgi:hypothetical protein
MKTHLVLALIGSAVAFAWPTFAQQTVDPKIVQQIRALAQKYDEAINKHDSVAIASLYAQTEFGGLMTTDHSTVRRLSKRRMGDGCLRLGKSGII